jgi:hypothetical protein
MEVFGEFKPRIKLPSTTDVKSLNDPTVMSGIVFDWENKSVYLFDSDRRFSITMNKNIYFKPFIDNDGNEY